MTCVVSLVSTLVGSGPALDMWLLSWVAVLGCCPGLLSWVIAFPTLLIVLPVVRRVTAAIVEPAAQAVPVPEPATIGSHTPAPAVRTEARDPR